MKSLTGACLLVTRAAEDARTWTDAIEARGGRARVLPCIRTEFLEQPAQEARLLQQLDGSAWLVLTSRRGALALQRILLRRPTTPEDPSALLDRRLQRPPQIAAVGPATARAAEGLGVPAYVGTAGGRRLAEDLLPELVRARDQGLQPRVVVAVAAEGRRDVEEVLSAAGFPVERCAVYRTIPWPAESQRLDLSNAGVDATLLASPSAVTGLLNRTVGAAEVPVIAIGETTEVAAAAAGLNVAGCARRPDLDSLLDAIPEEVLP